MITKEKILETIKECGPKNVAAAVRKSNSILIEDIVPISKKDEVKRIEEHLSNAIECLYDIEIGGTLTEKLCKIAEAAIEDSNHLVRLMGKRGEDPNAIRAMADLTGSYAELLQAFRDNIKSPIGKKKMKIPLLLLEGIKMTCNETLCRIMDEKEYALYRDGKELVRQVFREQMGEDPSTYTEIKNGTIIEGKQDKSNMN
jgi:hypothetical protein